MDLIVSVNEKPVGCLTTRVRATGLATPMEAEMVKRLAVAVNKALGEFDQSFSGASGGTGLRIVEREIKKG